MKMENEAEEMAGEEKKFETRSTTIWLNAKSLCAHSYISSSKMKKHD